MWPDLSGFHLLSKSQCFPSLGCRLPCRLGAPPGSCLQHQETSWPSLYQHFIPLCRPTCTKVNPEYLGSPSLKCINYAFRQLLLQYSPGVPILGTSPIAIRECRKGEGVGLCVELTCSDPTIFCQHHEPQIQILTANLCSGDTQGTLLLPCMWRSSCKGVMWLKFGSWDGCGVLGGPQCGSLLAGEISEHSRLWLPCTSGELWIALASGYLWTATWVPEAQPREGLQLLLYPAPWHRPHINSVAPISAEVRGIQQVKRVSQYDFTSLSSSEVLQIPSPFPGRLGWL